MQLVYYVLFYYLFIYLFILQRFFTNWEYIASNERVVYKYWI
jgi:hypothetical protein